MRLSVDLDPEIHRRLRLRAAADGTTVSSIVRELITASLEEDRGTPEDRIRDDDHEDARRHGVARRSRDQAGVVGGDGAPVPAVGEDRVVHPDRLVRPTTATEGGKGE